MIRIDCIADSSVYGVGRHKRVFHVYVVLTKTSCWRNKLPHKSRQSEAYNEGLGVEPPVGSRGGAPGQRSPLKLKGCLSEIKIRHKFVCPFLLSCKLLKYASWKNIAAFLFAVLLLFVTLWQQNVQSQEAWRLISRPYRKFAAETSSLIEVCAFVMEDEGCVVTVVLRSTYDQLRNEQQTVDDEHRASISISIGRRRRCLTSCCNCRRRSFRYVRHWAARLNSLLDCRHPVRGSHLHNGRSTRSTAELLKRLKPLLVLLQFTDSE